MKARAQQKGIEEIATEEDKAEAKRTTMEETAKVCTCSRFALRVALVSRLLFTFAAREVIKTTGNFVLCPCRNFRKARSFWTARS